MGQFEKALPGTAMKTVLLLIAALAGNGPCRRTWKP